MRKNKQLPLSLPLSSAPPRHAIQSRVTPLTKQSLVNTHSSLMRWASESVRKANDIRFTIKHSCPCYYYYYCPVSGDNLLTHLLATKKMNSLVLIFDELKAISSRSNLLQQASFWTKANLHACSSSANEFHSDYIFHVHLLMANVHVLACSRD